MLTSSARMLPEVFEHSSQLQFQSEQAQERRCVQSCGKGGVGLQSLQHKTRRSLTVNTVH